jgi:ABC-type sugar transport system permease subunit
MSLQTVAGSSRVGDEQPPGSERRAKPGSRKRGKPKSLNRWTAYFLLPGALFLLMMAAYPLVRLLQMSVSDVVPATLRRGLWDIVWLENFLEIFGRRDFLTSVTNTVFYTAIVLVVSLVLGFILASVLSSYPRVGRPLAALMMVIWLSPTIVAALLWKFVFAGNGLANAFLTDAGAEPIGFLLDGYLPLITVALVNSWMSIPFSTIIFRAAILDVPRELHEQAAIDGASLTQKMRMIMLPMLRPTFLVLGILLFLYAFKSFDFVFAMTAGGPGVASTTLPFLSWKLAFINFEYGEAAAVAVVSMVLIAGAAIPYVRALRQEER